MKKLSKVESIKLVVKTVLNILPKEDYLSKLLDNLEMQIATGNNLPFKIVDIKRKGFVIKVSGLFGYISYNHMPWHYQKDKSWDAIFPTIKDKIFFCKIHHFNKTPISIIIDGNIPQFKKPDFFEDIKYQGIVIHKTNFGVFIDLGYNFGWRCGSLVGMLHKSNIGPIELFDKINLGESIETYFFGFNDNGQPILGNNLELKEWATGEIEELIGEELAVSIIKTWQ